MLFFVLINVLKTGPDRPVRPVQPSTVKSSDPVHSIRPFGNWTGHEPLKPSVRPVTRLNRTVLHEPNSSYCPLFCTLKGSNELIYFSHPNNFVGWGLEPRWYLQPLVRMTFIGIHCILFSLRIRWKKMYTISTMRVWTLDVRFSYQHRKPLGCMRIYI